MPQLTNLDYTTKNIFAKKMEEEKDEKRNKILMLLWGHADPRISEMKNTKCKSLC